MEPLAEVVETSGGQGVVVVLPAELGGEVAAGGERLSGLDDLLNVLIPILPSFVFRRFGGAHIEVLGVNVGVLGKVVVLLSDENSL